MSYSVIIFDIVPVGIVPDDPIIETRLRIKCYIITLYFDIFV